MERASGVEQRMQVLRVLETELNKPGSRLPAKMGTDFALVGELHEWLQNSAEDSMAFQLTETLLKVCKANSSGIL